MMAITPHATWLSELKTRQISTRNNTCSTCYGRHKSSLSRTTRSPNQSQTCVVLDACVYVRGKR